MRWPRRSRVTMDERRDAYDRAVRLNERGIASGESLLTAKSAWQRAEAALKTAQATVRVAEADLKLQETNLAKACICAPIDGIVLKRSVEPGQIVAATLQAPVLFTLAENLTAMELTVVEPPARAAAPVAWVELRLAKGRVLRFESNIDDAALSRLIRAVDAA